jgi:putative nucleotidyltransferase with HDIG domain
MEPVELARQIVAALKSRGYQAYFVGGCVRDFLLGGQPKDYDVATDAHPEQIAALFPNSVLVGAQFGVVLVQAQTAQVEVATFRSDQAYVDGRHPAGVRFETDARLDVLRRDFTINALLLDPDSNQVSDFVGGRDDLRQRVIRAIGEPEARFREDHLRMLRAVRFAARLDYQIEQATFDAIRRLHGLILSVSAERVREELVRILTEGGARRGFAWLDATGLLSDILPEIAAMKGVAQPPEYHPEGDVWTHTLLLLENLRNPSATLALGALLHDVGKPPTFRVAERIRFDGHVEKGVEMAGTILNRLRFSHEQIRQVTSLVANHMRFKDTPQMKVSTLKRFLRLENFPEHLELHRLDCVSSNGHLENYELVRRHMQELPKEQLKPAPLITGTDLIAAGYRPGPAFTRMLAAIEDAQLESKIQNREDAMALVYAHFRIPDGGAI